MTTAGLRRVARMGCSVANDNGRPTVAWVQIGEVNIACARAGVNSATRFRPRCGIRWRRTCMA